MNQTSPNEMRCQWESLGPVVLPLNMCEGIRKAIVQPVDGTGSTSRVLVNWGHCLEAAGRLAEAQVAHALAPRNPVYLAFLAGAVRKEMPDWQRVQVDLGRNERREEPTK